MIFPLCRSLKIKKRKEEYFRALQRFSKIREDSILSETLKKPN
ncbi:hypothetical protein LEP1GSC194_3399 [Leptospira alstonii serovar Sichuan str. 79601]|uniref:Uncharacterized protein n=1 Tax=Leptospira alstonii serovar Sichuan str. 79601 TaxID=1218565 RepID=M6CL27_9LEPT|nr:hypothetical protein LEP1GSC194_3399 [Leptospira alstonii serovar Sichuan str. 79601]